MRRYRALLGALALACAAVLSAVASAQQKAANAPPARKPAAKPATKPAAKTPAKPAAPGEDAGLTAARELLVGFTRAYNAPDVAALAGLFTDDATVIDSNGDEVRGKEALGEMYATAFEDAPGVRLEAQLDGVRYITPDVARAEGRCRLSTGSGDASEFRRFSGLLVRKDGKWRIAEIHDYPMAVGDVTPYERLSELEWMVGDWVDEDPDNKVTASIRWADNRSYLIRTYTVELQGQKASSGTMFIGWDPQTGQIKSWLFDSGGGHGEGLWTRSADNEWVVKAHGVLRDGRPNSATLIHTVVNKDAVKTISIHRILGGQMAPDVPEILMVRKPPPPASDATPKPGPTTGADK
jgi:uncharacterized protein (TIGR02246 family)